MAKTIPNPNITTAGIMVMMASFDINLSFHS
jgi:hypothetical protein